MSEREVNERRNWKAQTFPYDYYIPDETKACLYCLTEKQAEILRGIIEPLGWKTRWWTDGDVDIDQDQILAYRDDIARRLMNDCCGDSAPVQYRYTEDGILQRSTDGGATWEDSPEYDPRVYSPQFPPVPTTGTDDPKCLASDSVVKLFREQIGDQLTDDMSRYTLQQLITDWVKNFLETSNPFQALMQVIANQIFALVISVVRPALTDEVYSQLRCIVYNHIDNTGFVSGENNDAIRADILDQIGGVAGAFLEHLVYLLGNGGMTNVARAGAGSPDTDCTSCVGTAELWQINALGGYDRVFPDEDGLYTVTSAYAEGGFYTMNLIFSSSLSGPDYGPCNDIEIVEDNPDRVNYRVNYRCHDAIPDALSHCNCEVQFRFNNAGSSIRVMLANSDPCT